MDTYDFFKPERFEKQIVVFKEKHNVDIVGSWVDKFEGDISNVISARKVLQSNKEIKKFAKKRNYFNPPSIMFKKDQF